MIGRKVVRSVNPHIRQRTVLSAASHRVWKRIGLILLLSTLAGACAPKRETVVRPQPPLPEKPLERVGYTIQVGAFANLDNAVRLSQKLLRAGLDAYYFIHPSGLYKVRFGDFPSKAPARRKAEDLYARGVIEDYYIVRPEVFPEFLDLAQARVHLRREIVETARRFVGVPYRWGGSSPDQGFDCSGLSMVAYQLNGLRLPRTSGQQWVAGSPVEKSQLSEADLVFFATRGRGKISHVGIYVGRNQFIHAPGRGKRIRIDSLSSRYYGRRYAGARTYL